MQVERQGFGRAISNREMPIIQSWRTNGSTLLLEWAYFTTRVEIGQRWMLSKRLKFPRKRHGSRHQLAKMADLPKRPTFDIWISHDETQPLFNITTAQILVLVGIRSFEGDCYSRDVAGAEGSFRFEQLTSTTRPFRAWKSACCDDSL